MQTRARMLVRKTLLGLMVPLTALAVGETAVASPFISVPPAQCTAATSLWTTPGGSTTSGGSVEAWACFNLTPGGLTLNLVSVQPNVKSAAQEISAISFHVSGAQSTGATIGSDTGSLGTIAAGGSYTIVPSAANPLTSWVVSQSGTGISLSALSGGQPAQLIIGPDSAGGISGSGNYSSANGSIVQHNPSVLELATFVLSIAGVTPDSTITDVVFQFGSAPGTNLVEGIDPVPPGTSVLASVPAPATIALVALGFAGIGFRRNRTRA